MYRATILALLLASSCDDKDDGDEGQDGSSVPQECQALLTCSEEADPDNADLYAQTYGEGGECYGTGAASEELDCIAACESLVVTLSAADPAAEGCWTDGSPDALLLFLQVDTRWRLTQGTPCDLVNMSGTMDVTATESGPDFEAFFQLEGDGLFADIEEQCTFSGRDFACSGEDQHGFPWDAAGSFEEGFEALSVEISVSEGGESFACAYDGEPW